MIHFFDDFLIFLMKINSRSNNRRGVNKARLGVIVDAADGIVVTNFHLIKDAMKFRLRSMTDAALKPGSLALTQNWMWQF